MSLPADKYCARCHRPFRDGDARVHPGEKCPKGWDCLLCGESGLYDDEKCGCDREKSTEGRLVMEHRYDLSVKRPCPTCGEMFYDQWSNLTADEMRKILQEGDRTSLSPRECLKCSSVSL